MQNFIIFVDALGWALVAMSIFKKVRPVENLFDSIREETFGLSHLLLIVGSISVVMWILTTEGYSASLLSDLAIYCLSGGSTLFLLWNLLSVLSAHEGGMVGGVGLLLQLLGYFAQHFPETVHSVKDLLLSVLALHSAP